ncbi:MAG: Asp-tRNA(Asn)/Glu-tRNA(Gln) amidotransferase GatCAB subunit A [Gammaproteobacteria bacterium]|jgi:aspartyl-tRNA(Asn)/glutamyl-tRNA(Gln) amidotransferase subunit A|nr:Asp-tRNA(Asn)/Glu-tRNA(Gln) amidotransferase GatCAB subunit A [Gammaproteobacteria bacterium]MDP7456215.1 Asp-tRNA(Asn)/Glu-tRNA(Gln) amidotransferase subunit GatA [Gammaproteobacteria bacterium]HJO12598.1 Asp-tRNA(Asn)/Glu-tRNA(Gln) amidotransferase subunit GatA [Gammaproteobacteria bacterium]
MIERTVAEISTALASGDISSVELTQAYLHRIEQYNTDLNAFITVCEESALEQAKAADKSRSDGDCKPLLGVPLAHKDIFCTKGVTTTCGSRMLQNFVPPYDATVVEKFNAAGVVTLGKTNMDEFAMGSSNETSFFGVVKNPWDTARVPGGSSGGSAAAVAADLCAMATGTDTGGSIRQPAAFCGVTGFKPSYGRVSRWGMVAFASSLDQAGSICKSAEDAAMMLNAMAGLDEKDSTSIDKATVDYTATLNDSLEGLKIGIPIQHFAEGLSAEVEQNILDALKVYESLGATIKEIDLPNNHLSVSAYYVIAPAEASANLSRYDGVRYGYRCAEPVDLEDMYKRSRSEGFGEEVKRRIMVGTYALSAGFYDAYYRKAQKIRRLIRNDFLAAFKEVDIILGPTSPHTAFELGAKSDPVAMYLEDIYTIAVNLAGLPGISIPAGTVNGLPVGLQLVGEDFAEAKVFNAAHQFQKNTDWHRNKPDLTGMES